MAEYAEELFASGMFENPLLLYDMTLHEVSLYADGMRKKNEEMEKRQNIRIGTVVATMLNLRRTKESDRVWTWEDVFGYGEEVKKSQTAEMTDEEIYSALLTAFGRYKT